MEQNKNLEILKEMRPSFYNSVMEIDKDDIETLVDSIETTMARDNNPIATITKEGKAYRLNSAFRPVEEAEKWVQKYSFNNLNNNVTMYGLGNGYFVRAILEKLPEKDFLFIYEPSAQMFLHALENYDLESILSDPRVVIGVEGINEFDFHKAIRAFYEVSNLGNSIITIHPVYDKLFLQSFESFKEEIKSSAESARINYNTLLFQAKSTFRNAFINIPKIKNSISITQLKKEWNPDVPAVLVAAGPSVEESIEELRQNRDKAVLVAVDRILDYLLDRGIRPDFVVTLDPKKNTKNFSKKEHVDVPMFCVMQSKPEIMDIQTGKKIICHSSSYLNDKYMEVLGEVPPVPTSGSVATFAAEILRYLGTKKIFLVGQDLAFRGESTHVGGVVSNPYSKKSKMIDGINGEKVSSRYDWIEYKTWFEEFLVKNPEIELIDTKTSGAFIKGTILMSLSEGLKDCEVLERNLEDTLKTIPAAFSEENFTALIEQMQAEKGQLIKMKQKAKEGVSYCSDIIHLVKQNKIQSRTIDSKANKVKEINQYLKNEAFYKQLDEMVISHMNSSYLKVFSNKEDEVENMLNVFDSSRTFFESVMEAVKFADDVLEETIRSLE